MYATVAAIVAFSLWSVRQFHACPDSDGGCVNGVVPGLAAFLTLAIQCCVLVPVYAVRRRRRGRPFVLPTGLWIVASIAAFQLPMRYVVDVSDPPAASSETPPPQP